MLTLYVHVPFCVKKCLYCGFYSSQYSHDEADVFISCLAREADFVCSEQGTLPVSSIYIGGGTPTCLTLEQLETLFAIVKRSFTLVENGEFTVEANPTTLNPDKLLLMHRAGVNRLSIGIQSFHDVLLKILGRAHSAMQAVIAFQDARDAGFDNINIDLIYGIPGQSSRQWKETLNTAVSLHPQHISAYSLSLEEHTPFHRDAAEGRFALPDDEVVVAQYEQAVEFLGETGYRRYEISNFALPGAECRHNNHYWRRGEYQGLGPGAWSFVGGKRLHNVADLKVFSNSLIMGVPARDHVERSGQQAAARESIFLGLRTMQGLDLAGFHREFGEALMRQLDVNIEQLSGSGLFHVQGGWLRLTERGILLSDEVVARISP